MSAPDKHACWSWSKAELMGLPHTGARYVGSSGRYELASGECCICGANATNAHHVVPLRNGRICRRETPSGFIDVRSPLFAVCGHGTAGCHGEFHSGRLRAFWVWYTDEGERLWRSGELLQMYGAHAEELFKFGAWQIKRNGETVAEIRS